MRSNWRATAARIRTPDSKVLARDDEVGHLARLFLYVARNGPGPDSLKDLPRPDSLKALPQG